MRAETVLAIMAISIALIICLFLFLRYKSRVAHQTTLRIALEKGHQLTPELLERFADVPRKPKSPNADLRWGIMAVALGVGIATFGFIVGAEDVQRPMVAIGNVPFLIGLAFLALWKFGPKE